ncbi:MAG: hypothetical protein L0G70_01130 [Rubrobacter sp.]|nr:hypothetical protein [Rubrobacter sp.]
MSTRTAIKAQTAKAGAVHSAIGEIQDLIEDAGSDEEREALQAAVDELKALAEKDEPDDADTATKAQSRAARKGRDTLGRKRRDSGVATKSAGEPRRDHLGRSNRRPGDQSQ